MNKKNIDRIFYFIEEYVVLFLVFEIFWKVEYLIIYKIIFN